MNTELTPQQQEEERLKPFKTLAERLDVDPHKVQQILVNTMVGAKKPNEMLTDDEVVAFMVVVNEYRLNPITKEVYAFSNRGTIQPMVSVDGWLRIMNTNPDFDGIEFDDKLDNDGNLMAITARIYRKNRSHPTEVTEYMAECKQPKKEPWQKWPIRMLRHKATIQCARYAFGLSGIYDPDEVDRIQSVAGNDDAPTTGNETVDATYEVQQTDEKPPYPADRFAKQFPGWEDSIREGRTTAENVIVKVSSSFTLSEEQKGAIRAIPVEEPAGAPTEEQPNETA